MIHVTTSVERWELIEPFATARDSVTHVPVLVVTLTGAGGHRGWAEAAGVDYDGETPETMASADRGREALAARRDPVRRAAAIVAGGRSPQCARLRAVGPAGEGGGRSGLDARRTRPPRPVTTAFTLGLASEEDTRRKAREARGYPLLKIKVDADRHVDLVRIVREEHPSARLIVDANQAWSRPLLERLLPDLRELGVELVEQPLPRGEDAALDGMSRVLPLAADESCTDLASLAGLAGRYDYVNLKLDKCGGLTEALAMCAEAKRRGLGLMVGNMCGTSLAMAPAFLVAQFCTYVDLDGPLLQKLDREPPIRFESGRMSPPQATLWG